MRRAGLARRHIGDADFRAVGKCRQRQQEAVGLRQAGQRPIALLGRLHGVGKYRRRRKHRRTRRQRFRERRIAVGGALIDQQEIDRDHLRLQPGDRLDDPGDLGARQRIAAGELDDGVVDRNDRDEVRRRLYAARQRSHI